MKKILFILLVTAATSVNAQKIVPVFGLEGGVLSGGLSGLNGYSSQIWGNGSFWIDFVGTNRSGDPTVGFKVKLNYNYYEMNDNGNGGGNITVSETTIPVLFKVCLSSNTQYTTKNEGGENRLYSLKRDLFLFAGPQVGFPTITGGSLKTAQKTDYSVVAGGELYLNNTIYLALYRQTGLSTIYPAQPNIKLSGFTAAFGFRLL